MLTRFLLPGLVVAAVTCFLRAESFAPLPKAVSSFGAAVSDGYLYTYGGHCGKTHAYSTDDVVGNFRRLKLASPTAWEELPGGPALQGLALVARGGQLYRLGGMQPRNKPDEDADTHSVATCARFDPKLGRWETMPDLPEPRSSHDAVVSGNHVYVIGGWTMNGKGSKPQWCKTSLRMDLTSPQLQWESFEQPFQIRALAVATWGGKIYAMGGLTASGSSLAVHVYDPAKKVWASGADLPGPKSNGFNPAACVVDDRLCVSMLDGRLFRLSSKGTSWEEVGKLHQNRMVHRVVPFGDHKLVALGGASVSGNIALVESAEVKAP